MELLGGGTSSYHGRECLGLRAKFLKEDLPYFTELLAEVISKTRYTTHELSEEVLHVMNLHRKSILASPHDLAMNSVHAVAFHRGLGVPLYPVSTYPMKYLDAPAIADFSDAAYARNNMAVVCNGTTHSELSKWVKEFYADVGTGSATMKLKAEPTKYHGGEERVAHSAGNVMILGFPGSPSFSSGTGFKPELHVLAALLGGETSIKWSPGFSLLSKAVDKAALTHTVAHISTTQQSYSDAGLLLVTLSGKGADVAFAGKVVVDAIKQVASGKIDQEDLKKATMLAKFRALEAGQAADVGLEGTGMGLIGGGTPHQIDEIAGQIEKVSGETVKKVSFTPLCLQTDVVGIGANQNHRLRKRYSTRKPASRQWVICTLYHLRRRSACKYKTDQFDVTGQ